MILLIAVIVIALTVTAVTAFGIGILYYPSELQQVVLIGGLMYLAVQEIIIWVKKR